MEKDTFSEVLQRLRETSTELREAVARLRISTDLTKERVAALEAEYGLEAPRPNLRVIEGQGSNSH